MRRSKKVTLKSLLRFHVYLNGEHVHKGTAMEQSFLTLEAAKGQADVMAQSGIACVKSPTGAVLYVGEAAR